MTFLIAFLVAAAGQPATTPPAASPSDPAAPAAKPERFEPAAPGVARATDPKDAKALETLLLTIAGEYAKYVRVSDRAQWAPERCDLPRPSGAASSASTQEATHGKKLYYLYAADAEAYEDVGHKNRGKDEGGRDVARPGRWRNPVGMIVVKEAFKPVEVKEGEKVPEPSAEDRARGYVQHSGVITKEGKTFRTGEAAGLFIMVKLDAKHAGTDEGWVYATTSPDGKKVTASGVIESCVECHRGTGRDRLYGPAWSWPRDEHQRPVAPGRGGGQNETKEKGGA